MYLYVTIQIVRRGQLGGGLSPDDGDSGAALPAAGGAFRAACVAVLWHLDFVPPPVLGCAGGACPLRPAAWKPSKL